MAIGRPTSISSGATIPPLTDEEEAEIQRQIAEDPDDAEATDEELAQAQAFIEAFPDLVERH